MIVIPGRHVKECVVCNVRFTSKFPHTISCSNICKKKYESTRSGRRAIANSQIAKGTVGAISEIEVSIDLMRKGYSVFRALSPACFCDIIAIKNESILRVECKTGYVHSGSGTLTFSKNKHGKIDIFAIFIHETHSIVYRKEDAMTPIDI